MLSWAACSNQSHVHEHRILNVASSHSAFGAGNEALYSKECSTNPCWVASLNNISSPALKFSDYKKLCYKWQHAVLAATRTALASNEYVQTRNALLFLSYNTKVSLSSADCLLSLLQSELLLPLCWVIYHMSLLLAQVSAKFWKAVTLGLPCSAPPDSLTAL